MANVKLSDAELATRVRERVKRNCAKYRERKALSGSTQTLVWLPDRIRRELDTLVEERNESLSAVTTALLSSALATNQTQTVATPRPAIDDITVDMFSEPATDTRPGEPSALRVLTQAERDERDRAIVELHRQLGNNHEVGRQLGCNESMVRRALKNASQTE